MPGLEGIVLGFVARCLIGYDSEQIQAEFWSRYFRPHPLFDKQSFKFACLVGLQWLSKGKARAGASMVNQVCWSGGES